VRAITGRCEGRTREAATAGHPVKQSRILAHDALIWQSILFISQRLSSLWQRLGPHLCSRAARVDTAVNDIFVTRLSRHDMLG
jgi:hypothetical protein